MARLWPGIGSADGPPGEQHFLFESGVPEAVATTTRCGGGEIKFDGKLVRKNGEFVAKGLDSLNGG